MKRGSFRKKTYEEVLSIKKSTKAPAKGRILTTKRVIKSKEKSITYYKKKLWEVFSLYIRQRDNFTCFTCGRKGEGGGMHAGHFIPKSVGGIDLYFNEENVNAQCYNCNINLGGNQYVYGLKLGDKAQKLYERKGIYTKWGAQEYKEKIEYYKNLIQR
jgi:hypothetical protein